MSAIRLIYILLHIFEIVMLFVAGKKLSKTTTDREYWNASIWAFIPYVIVLGFRFGHNIDWNYYYIRYEEMKTMDWDTTEPLFNFTFYIFNTLGIPYFLVITLQVSFFMFSFLLIAKYFRNCLYYVLPLLPVVAMSNDNYIRWYWGVSFILIGFYYLLSERRGKYFLSMIFFICGVLFHNGTLLLGVLWPLYFFGGKKIIPLMVSVPVLFISIFFITISIMLPFIRIISDIYIYVDFFNISHYLLQMEKIISEGWTEAAGIKQYSIEWKLITFIATMPVIIYAPKFLVLYKHGILIYNLFVIGACLNPFFGTVELFDRYSKMLLIFQAIVAGIMCYRLFYNKKSNVILYLICFLSLLCNFYPFIKYVIYTTGDYRMMYVWNANGKKYIDPSIYIDDMLKNR